MPDNENYIARIASIAKDSWVSEAGCDTQKSRKSKVPLFGMLIGMSTSYLPSGEEPTTSVITSALAASFSITPLNGSSLAGRPGPKFATAVTFRTATSLRQQLLKSGSRPKVVKHEVPYQALPQ